MRLTGRGKAGSRYPRTQRPGKRADPDGPAVANQALCIKCALTFHSLLAILSMRSLLAQLAQQPTEPQRTGRVACGMCRVWKGSYLVCPTLRARGAQCSWSELGGYQF